MAASEPGLGTRILGDRWSVADGTPKPAWVQIEEQLADRIEAGALAPGDRLPPEALHLHLAHLGHDRRRLTRLP